MSLLEILSLQLNKIELLHNYMSFILKKKKVLHARFLQNSCLSRTPADGFISTYQNFQRKINSTLKFT